RRDGILVAGMQCRMPTAGNTKLETPITKLPFPAAPRLISTSLKNKSQNSYCILTFAQFVTKKNRSLLKMPKDNSIKSVLIIGSGPIIIGQACEFDYSGSQAARSIREEGIKVILINSNPATIL